MHSLLDLNLAAELHRGRSSGRLPSLRARGRSDRPAPAVVTPVAPEVHAGPTH